MDGNDIRTSRDDTVVILGIGFDLVEIDRIKRLYETRQDAFVAHLLTGTERVGFNEIQHERRRIEWLSGRFAAKEAFVKAAGTGFNKSIGLHSIEVLSNTSGRPELQVKDSVFEIWPVDATIQFHLSITHTNTTAGAVVLIEQT